MAKPRLSRLNLERAAKRGKPVSVIVPSAPISAYVENAVPGEPFFRYMFADGGTLSGIRFVVESLSVPQAFIEISSQSAMKGRTIRIPVKAGTNVTAESYEVEAGERFSVSLLPGADPDKPVSAKGLWFSMVLELEMSGPQVAGIVTDA